MKRILAVIVFFAVATTLRGSPFPLVFVSRFFPAYPIGRWTRHFSFFKLNTQSEIKMRKENVR